MTDLRIELPRLRSENLPHADASVFGELPEGTVCDYGENITPQQHAAHFIPGQAECPACGHDGIEWSIAHGVAHCTGCGYPCRVYHHFRRPGEDRDTLVQRPLWYHPDELSVNL